MAGRILLTILAIGVLTSALIVGIFMIYVKTTLAPTLEVNADDYTMNLSSIVWYQDKDSGEWKELQMLRSEENRIWVDYDQMPDALWQAAVSIEDERFFQHHGVDWKRTFGATVNMFLGMRDTFGGSTITQQLLKNMTKDNAGTVNRKVREIFRALEFEKNYSKEDILELYLNTIYLGRSCYGVETAAQYYFGKDVSELTVAECASLIAITNNPSMYGPMYNITITRKDGSKVTPRELNKERQEMILDKMVSKNYLSKEEAAAAKAETLPFTDGSTSAQELAAAADSNTTGSNDLYNSFFVDQLIRDVSADLGKKLGISTEEARTKLYYGGYNIYATIDPEIQDIAESVYEDRSNLNVTSRDGQLIRSGITIVDVSSGNVVATVGDIGEKTGNLVWDFATDTRQPGSSIKPLTVYAPAIDAGVVTMASTFDNYPVRLLNGNPWPKNSPNKYTGWTTLAKGVASSINTVAVQVVEKLGVRNAYSFATENLNLNLVASDMDVSPLGLGGLTYGLNTRAMAAAYASFANSGVYNAPRLYLEVKDSDGNVVLENEQESRAAMKETTAYFMNKLLKGVVTSGTGTAANFGGMTIAGKTGTTSDNYDRYFVGYTPYYSAAVWTGYKYNAKVVYNGNPSITLWKKVMQKIHANLPNKDFPAVTSGLTKVTVCLDSGKLASEACAMDSRGSRVTTVEVASGTAPTETCTMHVVRNYCTEGQCLAGDTCPESSVVQRSFLDYTRTSYGGISAADDAYLLGHMEAAAAAGCPVHGGGQNPDAQDPENPDDGTTTPGEGEDPSQPSEPENPPATAPSTGGDTGGDWGVVDHEPNG